MSYFSWICSQQEPTLLQLYKNLDNWNAPHHVFQSKSQQFSIYPLAANCPDIWSKLWLQLSGTGVCSVQINCFQTVHFICAIFLNTSLKTRLVRTLGYHLFSTKDYEFLHCFQNKWKIYFPGISLFNGNVSILMQNFKKKIILELLNRKTGDCSATLNFFLAVSFPFYRYITIFFMSEMLLKGCFYVFDIPKDKPSLEPRKFIRGFVCLFRFWLFIISQNENKLQNVRIHLGIEISSSNSSEFDHKTGWIISLIGLASHTGFQRTGHHSSPSPERCTALVSGSLNLG